MPERHSALRPPTAAAILPGLLLVHPPACPARPGPGARRDNCECVPANPGLGSFHHTSRRRGLLRSQARECFPAMDIDRAGSQPRAKTERPGSRNRPDPQRPEPEAEYLRAVRAMAAA